MIDLNTFKFVGSIYDTVLAPSRWEETLDEFTSVIGAGTATLQVFDHMHTKHQCDVVSERLRNAIKADSHPPEFFEQIWREELQAYEYMIENSEIGFIPEHVCLGISEDAIEQHNPAKWLSENFGIAWRMGCSLNTNNAWHDLLCVQYMNGQTIPSKPEIDFANLFIPHFAKAVDLSRTFVVLKARYQALFDALDHYRVGTIITTADGTIILANEEAQRIIDSDSGITKTAGNRMALNHFENQTFYELLARVSATSKNEAMTAEQIVSYTETPNSDPILLSICPLRDPENDLDLLFHGAIIYITDPKSIGHVSTAGLSKLYGLTHAEEQVCELLVDGLSTTQIAESRGVTIETTRWQIKQLLNKTRCRNRTELIRLAQSVNLPIDVPRTSDT